MINVEYIWLTSFKQCKSRFPLMISISRYTLTDSMTGVLILKPSLSCFRWKSCFQVHQVWRLGEERHSILQLPRLRSHLCSLCEAAHMRHQHPLTAPLTSSSSPILDNLYLSRLHSTSSSTFCSYIDTFQLLTFLGLMMVKLQIPKIDLMVLPRLEIIAHLKHRACKGLWQCTVSYHGIWWRRNCVFVSGKGLPCPSLLVSKGSLKSIYSDWMAPKWVFFDCYNFLQFVLIYILSPKEIQ